jgi:hypothetical protein
MTTLAASMGVMNPPEHTDVNFMHKANNLWTMKISLLLKDPKGKQSDDMKKVVLLFMLPPDLQDMFYQTVEATKSCEEVRDKVKAVVKQRLARNTKVGTPMDNGQVENNMVEKECDNEIYTVGKGVCHSCGEHGQFARECPKGGGKGKSNDAKGEDSSRFCVKGGGKDQGHGKGYYNYKGGYMGVRKGTGQGGHGYKGKGKGNLWHRPAWPLAYDYEY